MLCGKKNLLIKKQNKKIKQKSLVSSYIACHLHRMVGDGTLKNNNINGLELHKDAFDLFSQFTLSGCFQINHDTNISF